MLLIKKQEKDDYIEKLSELISQKINNTDDLKKFLIRLIFKKLPIKLTYRKLLIILI